MSTTVLERDAGTRRLRILLYSATEPHQAGGVQAAMRQLESGLGAAGHRVQSAWAGGGERLTLPLRLRDPRGGWAAPAAQLLTLWRVLRPLRLDVVNVHFLTGQALYFAALAPVLGYKLALSAHGSDVKRMTAGVRRLVALLLRRADAVTVVSRDLEAAVRALPGCRPQRLHRIPNGMDLGFWSGAPRREALQPVLLAAGRLEQVKGFDVLLQASARLRPRYPDLRLEIAGSGSQEAPLRALAGRLGLADAVTFLGRLDAPRLRERLSVCQAFALPSRSEGLPLGLLEAMAAGAPIAASAVGGVAEAASGAALLVPGGDAGALAEALDRLLREPELRRALSRQARERAQLYDASETTAAYGGLFAGLCAGPPRTAPALGAP